MPFDWKQYLDLARELAGSTPSDAGQQEARLRSSISRAYYAAFCYARNHCRDVFGFQPTYGTDDHFQVRDFLRHKVGKRQGIADMLDRLRRWRNKADYDDSLTLDLPKVASNAVSEANKVIYLLPPPKPPTAGTSA